MFVHGGTVAEVAAALNAAPTEFLIGCRKRFTTSQGRAPGESEQASWKKSWPELMRALLRAGLGELHLLLEYELPGSGQRVDALLLGLRRDGGVTAVVVELKQWTTIDSTSSVSTSVLRTHYTHPCRQAAGYVAYFDDWVDEPDLRLRTRAVAYLHNAGRDVVDTLRAAVVGKAGSGDVSLIGRDDIVSAADPVVLASLFAADDLRPPGEADLRRFLTAGHRPSGGLLSRLDDMLSSDPVFRLIGAQQRAYLHVLDTVREARGKDGKHVVVVSGGPGTGKTVIAARLVTDIGKSIGNGVFGCYLTPSGTLHQQLKRAAAIPAADGLFLHVDGFNRHAGKAVVPLVDEAQRLRHSARHLERMLARTKVCVLFLDERQIIRPEEGYTIEELQQEARRLGAEFTRVDLVSQFRCGGSQRYLTWLEQLLFGHTTATPWTPSEYDLAVAADPAALGEWVEQHTRHGRTARIAAGFCWPWTTPQRDGSLAEDVSITWTDPDGAEHTWSRPWNAAKEMQHHDNPVPRSQFWATDRGGHRQIGCIYTAQGLEYDYAAVVFGRDLVRRGDRWVAVPQENQDRSIPGDADPDRYLRWAVNTYWVLATRGTLGCRLYSVDEETQAFLTGLVHPASF
ncbi:DNA/RNA helicase domain-containing protein [Umezawaea beigongshangensis]|uniref:DNA/RNA helicase domain-containing protein n=1 Tax=Umezawaea beigongshangensis TaxID=2780383 RepID=UPI0018F15E1C|nr:DNA/RNA helicase domain-containing protein [Umezawaea beigongshangensis]